MKPEPAARALQRFLTDEKLLPFVKVFSRFDVADCAPFWCWMATAKARSVIAWCKRIERRGWRLGTNPNVRDLPWFSNGRGGRR